MITLLEKKVYPACPPDRGYLLRWYFNGWHYYNFIGGDESFTTTGAMHSTESSGKIKVGAAFLTRNDIRAIRGLLLSDQPAVLTSEGWKAVVVESTTLKVDGNDTEGYSCEFSVTVYAKVADYSPIIPTPEPVTTDLDVLRYIRNSNPQSILPALWSEDKDPHTEWWDANSYRGVLFGDNFALQEIADNNNVMLPDVLDPNKVYLIYLKDSNLSTVQRIKELTELVMLNLENNSLQTLDLSGLNKLQLLYISNSTQTSTLDLTEFIALKELTCSNLSLTSLNTNHLTDLSALDCSNNNLQTLTLPASYSNLNTLIVNNNHLQTIDSLINKGYTNRYDFRYNDMPVAETNRIADLGFNPQYILPQNP